jgi:transcriptional regulator with XRE-family HTH domain
MNTAAALRVLRAARDITQVDLAPIVGCTPQYLAMLESGARHPSKRLLARLLTAFEVNDATWDALTCGPGDPVATLRGFVPPDALRDRLEDAFGYVPLWLRGDLIAAWNDAHPSALLAR